MSRLAPRPGRTTSIVLLATGVIAAGSLIGVTTAAFTMSSDAAATVSGSLDIAQDAAGTVQADTPVTATKLPVSGLVTTLPATPVAAPTQHGASFATDLYNLSPSVAVASSVRITDTGAAGANNPFTHMLFGVYVAGKPVGDGIPLTAAQLAEKNAAGGVPLGAAIAAGAHSTVEVRLWLAPDAPVAAYSQAASLQLEIVGETVGGEQFTLKGVWS